MREGDLWRRGSNRLGVGAIIRCFCSTLECVFPLLVLPGWGADGFVFPGCRSRAQTKGFSTRLQTQCSITTRGTIRSDGRRCMWILGSTAMYVRLAGVDLYRC